ncbi:MAG: hypothetical protein RL120_16110 [Gammaproteobacteria bacterium]
MAITAPGHAQDVALPQVKDNVEIFSGILMQSLDLDQSTGLFGLSRGGVDGSYLMGQGALFEVQSPLAGQRSRIGLASLSNAMQSLPSGASPLAMLRRNGSTEDTPVAAMTLRGSGADNYYTEMMDRIANVDYTLAVNSALQQSYDAARSLFSLGNIDESLYQEMRAELDALNQSVEQRFADLRQMRTEVQSQASLNSNAESTSLQERLDTLVAEIEPLREQVLARAEELKRRNQQAADDYTRSWRQQVVEFESRVYDVVCNYGATLRAVPASENITIVLRGLGEDAADNSLTDKILVFRKADAEQCQGGAIDVAALRDRAIAYSY